VPSLGTAVRVIGKKEVEAKLLEAAPRILANNRMLVTEMLGAVKADLQTITPLGPGHFGYHLRDSYKVEVASRGVETAGSLSAPLQGYWREFGTRGGHRARKGRRVQSRVRISSGGGGEKAGMYASRALNAVRRMINFYYGRAQWWRQGL